MNKIFAKSAISLGKIIIAAVLVWFTYLLFLVKTKGEFYFGLILLIFVTIPTIFIVFFKNKFVAKYPGFIKPWKILRVIYSVILVLFVFVLAFSAYRAYDINKTESAVELISSTKITLDDVMGKNLPLEPDKNLNDSTIAGIDANKNYIRDDVELAIFKKYPDSAKIRAAELQYAQALQLELTQVSNSETLIETIRKEALAYNCLGVSELSMSLFILQNREKELEGLVLDTNLRKEEQQDNLRKYMTTYSLMPGQDCDVDSSSLPN